MSPLARRRRARQQRQGKPEPLWLDLERIRNNWRNGRRRGPPAELLFGSEEARDRFRKAVGKKQREQWRRRAFALLRRLGAR